MKSERFRPIDELISALEAALTESDWDSLAALNNQIESAVKPLMSAVESGELPAEPVRERLAKLQTFCDRANISAKNAQQEAKKALEDMQQNKSAAKAYQSVSQNHRK